MDAKRRAFPWAGFWRDLAGVFGSKVGVKDCQQWTDTNFNMDIPQLTRFLFYTPDLGTIQTFYTILGIKWIYGRELVFSETGLPEGPHSKASHERGLPDLWGDFGDLEFVFFLDRSLSLHPYAGLAFRVDVEDPSVIVTHLKAAGLFVPASARGNPPLVEILDPDGRHIILSLRGLAW
jgi:hypothetical protein